MNCTTQVFCPGILEFVARRGHYPNLIGNLRLQRHTFEAIAKQFQMTDCKEIVCNIAAWSYSDESGPFFTVEILPPYKRTTTSQPNILDAIFNNDEEQN